MLQCMQCFSETDSIYKEVLAILKEIWRILHSFKISDRLFPLYYTYIKIHVIPKWPSCVKCGAWKSPLKKHSSPNNIHGI